MTQAPKWWQERGPGARVVEGRSTGPFGIMVFVILTVSAPQRRARLVARHRLALAAGSVAEAVESMIALHATDPVTVYLSAWARTGCAADDVDEAIYNERVLVRMLGMRRTMLVVPAAARAGRAGGVHG